MAFTINTRTITDTATKSVIMAFGIDSSPAAAASATIYDSSAATYALATLTLSAVTTSSDRFCIGEIVTSDSISMVVQNQSLGTNTMTVYRCTSGTDSTPLGWSGSTLPGTTEAIVGSISGTHTITTSGTVASALVARTIQINGVTHLVFNKMDVLTEIESWSLVENDTMKRFDSEKGFTEFILRYLVPQRLHQVHFSRHKDKI